MSNTARQASKTNSTARQLPETIFKWWDTYRCGAEKKTKQEQLLEILWLDRLQSLTDTVSIAYKGSYVWVVDTQTQKFIIPLWKFHSLEYMWEWLFKVGEIGNWWVYDINTKKNILPIMKLDNISYDEDEKMFYLDFRWKTFEVSTEQLISWEITIQHINDFFAPKKQ